MAGMKQFTLEELGQFNGKGGRPLYVSIMGNVYDCSDATEHYGEGKEHSIFAGKDISRCMGKWQNEDTELNAAWDNLSEENMKRLQEWSDRFGKKYTRVGKIVMDDDFKARGLSFDP